MNRGGQPQSWECKDCGSCWAEYKAKKCLHCLSKNIFIFWQPGKKYKPKRIKLKTLKRIKLKIKE